tara:strand:+ start:325 stop:666 length:342 start_codon:yes stop_codon:yes gene_type:complete
MVRISRFASKYHTTPKKKTPKLKDILTDDQLATIVSTGKPKKYAKGFKKQTSLSKKEMKRPDPDARAEFFGEKKPTGFMNIDVKGKVRELKALTRKERLDLARFKNKQKARRK